MADEVTIAVSANSVKHKKQRKVEKPLKFLSHEEIEALFRVIASPRDRAMFRIIYHRGLRASEAGQIQISDWSPETERLMVRRRKGSISAPFKLTAIESRAIRAWLKIRGTAAGPMFLAGTTAGAGFARGGHPTSCVLGELTHLHFQGFDAPLAVVGMAARPLGVPGQSPHQFVVTSLVLATCPA